MTDLADRVVGMRGKAEATMIDRCRLVGDPDRTQDEPYDELALALAPPPGDPVKLWPADPAADGPCLVNYRNLGRGAEDRGSVLEYVIALPWNMAPLPLVGQWIEITATAVLPGVAGATLTIAQVERATLAPYVRVRASLVTERERPPGG